MNSIDDCVLRLSKKRYIGH